MQNEFFFQHYLVVFCDHLGQRQKLRKLTGIPTIEEDQNKFIELTKESIGRVIQIRDAFKDYFEASKACETNVNRVRPELREEFIASQKRANLIYYGMSDAIVIAVPLMSEADDCSAINAVYDAFVATCGIGLLSLSIHVPMRAGLDVGVATQIEDKEIYGPALESAFYLESNLAEYPRLLVGKELLSYLYWVENKKCETRLGLVAKETAKFCREMIIRDSDGRFMLDFLGNKIKESSDGVIDKKLVADALDFVIVSHKQYHKTEDEALESRYFRLLRYFESRKSIWGL
jgi:hypothetical protein